MQKKLLTSILTITAFIAFSQKKSLTNDQYFKNNFKNIINPLPVINRWVDDSHFLMYKDGKYLLVDASNGNEREATEPEKNFTFPTSKDAYVKGNDLFIKTVKTT